MPVYFFLQEDLNTNDGAWLALATEGDPHVLGMLLWDWLDQLKVIVVTQISGNLLIFHAF